MTGDLNRTNIPTILVVFGATGDLMARKITPALWDLFSRGFLPERFEIVGFARREFSDDAFRVRTKEILDGFYSEKDFSQLLSRVSYHRGNLENQSDYHALAGRLKEIDDVWGQCSNKLFYLAVPPELLEGIFKNLEASGLTIPCGIDGTDPVSHGEPASQGGWTRVLVEKPFGKDLDTAERLDRMLGEYFKEDQIYRIDHYLAKDMLQNILVFRFSNDIFENIWSNRFIESIDIRLLETLDLKKRGAFYDGIGAFRDVGQNHLLQMLAFITMERPQSFNAADLRKARTDILKTLAVFSDEDVRARTFRAQHEGYHDIEGVAKKSETDTYFRAEADLEHPRWRGVRITLESGKVMAEQRKEIIVTFRHEVPCLCPKGGEHRTNHIIFRIEPEEEIKIQFWSKEPGFNFSLGSSTLDFLYRARDGKRLQYVEEYEKLLLDCISGDQTAFVGTEEIAAMWRYTDPIVRAWQKGAVPLETYRPHEDEIVHRAKKISTHGLLEKKIAIVGLGKMGANLACRLESKGWDVFGFDAGDPIEEVPRVLCSPRIVWLMVPHNKVDEVLFGEKALADILERGDIVIDGGNSFYKDSAARAAKLKKRGIYFVDVGVSGGPSGALRGASLMIGGLPAQAGEREVFKKLEPLFRDIAAPAGYQFFEGAGAGHFIKMIHNGIEYGMMQALAEGFEILKNAKFALNLERVADIYNHGSVIESRLAGWLRDAFELHGENLENVSGKVAHTGEGAWTVETAREFGVKAKVIEVALQFRIESEKNPTYTGKILSALRHQFGGHSTK